MQFDYFEGPEREMSSFVGEAICTICGRQGPCFSLDSSICAEVPTEMRETAKGCRECLAEGRFEFWHDTEIGLLDERGLRKFYSHHRDPSEPFQPEALRALRRTPQIITWQQESWLVHCQDFMAYIGTWAAADFFAHAPDGDGRAIFLAMTDEGTDLWSDEVTQETDWYATYYAFKCRHCGKLRGNYDFP